MTERIDWEAKTRGILRGAMAQKDVTYAQLAMRLAAFGIAEDERNLRNKINGGKFSAAFFVGCLAALELRRLVIDAYDDPTSPDAVSIFVDRH